MILGKYFVSVLGYKQVLFTAYANVVKHGRDRTTNNNKEEEVFFTKRTLSYKEFGAEGNDSVINRVPWCQHFITRKFKQLVLMMAERSIFTSLKY